MANNVYECLFLLDANRYARDPGGISGQVPEMIEKNGGEVLASRLWNEQKLAYQINGQRKGTYWLTYFSMPGANLDEFNETCRLNDNLLRHLVLRIDNRLVDTLVSHARGDVVEAPPEAPAAPATADKADKEATATETAAE